jgi:hypothetical protein
VLEVAVWHALVKVGTAEQVLKTVDGALILFFGRIIASGELTVVSADDLAGTADLEFETQDGALILFFGCVVA